MLTKNSVTVVRGNTFKSRLKAAFLFVGTKASDKDWAALLNSTCINNHERETLVKR
jgi:hypothetical protein